MSAFRKCAACGNTFGGESYKKLCPECYNTTTPAKESHHPALIYEREHKPEPIIPATPEFVEEQLAKLKEIVAFDVEEKAKAKRRAWECEHVFVGPQQICECGVWQLQFLDGIEIELEHQHEP